MLRRLDKSPFHSRFAQHLFVLFFLASALPVATLAYLVHQDVFTKVSTAVATDLHRNTKSIAGSLFGQLERSALALHELAIPADWPALIDESPDKLQLTWNNELFRGVLLLATDGRRLTLAGEPFLQFSLSPEQIRRLNQGDTVLVTNTNGGVPAQFSIARLLNWPGNTTTTPVLVANLRVDALLAAAQSSTEDTEFCVFLPNNVPLACSDPHISLDGLAAAITDANAPHSLIEWKADEQEYVSYSWLLFLDGAYASSSWQVVSIRPRASTLAAVDALKANIARVSVLTLMLVVLVVSYHLRRKTRPLDDLRAATNLVASGQFETRVEIESDDELKELGAAFNSMTKRLDRLFKNLRTVSEVDRVMLTALDMDFIVNTITRRIGEMVGANSAAFAYLTTGDEPNKAPNDSHGPHSDQLIQAFSIANAEHTTLLRNPHHLLVSVKDAPLKQLALDTSYGYTTLLVFPIVLDGRAQGMVILKFNDAPNLTADDIQQARSLADRIAVGLTNANRDRKLYEQTNYDSLTALPNRRQLQDHLRQLIQKATRNHQRGALLLLDIDDFRTINEIGDHPAGDLAIKEIAKRLQSTIVSDCFLGRFGGDEFAIIVPNIEASGQQSTNLLETVNRLRVALNTPLPIGGHEFRLTASFGIAVFPDDAPDADRLLRFAEFALYHAKGTGRGKFYFYSPAVNEKYVSQVVLLAELQHAVAHGQLELHFQPKVDTRTGRMVGAEALIRWNHPERGLVPPLDFLPVAASAGLMPQIDNWVIAEVASHFRRWREANLAAPPIAINLSPPSFADPDLTGRIQRTFAAHQVDVRQLEVEITEETIVGDINRTMETLHALHNLGIKISIDDFGTGYSSLNYLARFPISYLKIDRSFIVEMTSDPAFSTIVSAIIALAHSLKLEVVAEGVSSPEHVPVLKEFGCDVLQGFLISKPLRNDAFIAFTARNENATPASSRAYQFVNPESTV